jgi:predicted outer membrane protein
VAGALSILAAPLALTAEPAPDHFIKDAIEGNLAEVQVGDPAQQKGASQGVKDFGATLAGAIRKEGRSEGEAGNAGAQVGKAAQRPFGEKGEEP